MLFSNQVNDTRKVFYSSWQKHLCNQPLEALEKQVVDVILSHPEYHALLRDEAVSMAHYSPELGQTNPFLHMGLHLAIREQVSTDRPKGIKAIANQFLIKYQDPLVVEHKMMDSLIECLWLSQRNNCMPDEVTYLEQLRQAL